MSVDTTIERPVSPDPYDLLPPRPSFTVTSDDVTDGQPLQDDQVGGRGQQLAAALAGPARPRARGPSSVTCFDPDAPTPSGFWHWALVDLPADTTSLAAGAGAPGARASPAAPSCSATTVARPASWAPLPRRTTSPTATSSSCTPSARRRSGIDADASNAVMSFNLAFKTLGRAIVHGTYQH